MSRVLVTNDDGIDSPGLHHLARVLHADGHTVTTQTAEWGDADTSDLLTGISRDVDKYLWFLEAHLQAKR